MRYKLKTTTEAFEIVDGPFAGKQYRREGMYDQVPPQYMNKFEEIKKEPLVMKGPVLSPQVGGVEVADLATGRKIPPKTKKEDSKS